jgi:hypothetical protein
MGDGKPALDHARAFVRRNPERTDVLDAVLPGPVPPGAAVATRVFEVLSSSRSVGFAGPAAITITDLDAYGRVMGDPVTPRDARLVLLMDAAYRDEVASHG